MESQTGKTPPESYNREYPITIECEIEVKAMIRLDEDANMEKKTWIRDTINWIQRASPLHPPLVQEAEIELWDWK